MKYIDAIRAAVSENKYESNPSELILHLIFNEASDNSKFPDIIYITHDLKIKNNFSEIKVEINITYYLFDGGPIMETPLANLLLKIDDFKFTTLELINYILPDNFNGDIDTPLFDLDGSINRWCFSICNPDKLIYEEKNLVDEIEFNHDEFINELFILSKSVELYKEYIKITDDKIRKVYIDFQKNL